MSESKLNIRKQMPYLGPVEHAELFHIVQKYTSTFTTTNTGALVSADELPEECIRELASRISFFMDLRALFKQEDERRHDKKRID